MVLQTKKYLLLFLAATVHTKPVNSKETLHQLRGSSRCVDWVRLEYHLEDHYKERHPTHEVPVDKIPGEEEIERVKTMECNN